jgi:hypothetical protein
MTMRIRLMILAIAFGVLMPLVASAQQHYSDQAALAADTAFINRVKIAAVQYAINDVSVESDAVDRHQQRLALAVKIVQSPDAWARLLTVGVTADLTFTPEVSDAAIFSRVAFIWNTYAN